MAKRKSTVADAIPTCVLRSDGGLSRKRPRVAAKGLAGLIDGL
ncbi:hypothetical protein [Brenneria uluponensis]|nr:hypothetical protein [Brenneria ulupoensis]